MATTKGGTRFSPLDQIDTSNVSGLTEVWEVEMVATVTGEMNALQFMPTMVGGTLYACDGNNGVHAFDAETGAVCAGGASCSMARNHCDRAWVRGRRHWNVISLDADRGVMIVNGTQVPDRLELITREESTHRNSQISPGLDAGGQTDQPVLNTPYGAYRAQFLSPLGSPCTALP